MNPPCCCIMKKRKSKKLESNCSRYRGDIKRSETNKDCRTSQRSRRNNLFFSLHFGGVSDGPCSGHTRKNFRVSYCTTSSFNFPSSRLLCPLTFLSHHSLTRTHTRTHTFFTHYHPSAFYILHTFHNLPHLVNIFPLPTYYSSSRLDRQKRNETNDVNKGTHARDIKQLLETASFVLFSL